MKKVGVCTVYTGYNYGSALQAVATKEMLRQLGYSGEIIKLSGSIAPGRDIRLKKLLIMVARSLRHFHEAKGTLGAYTRAGKELSPETKQRFDEFYSTDVCPSFYSETALKRCAKGEKYIAFLCGSDQIWNATTYYVDPFYYLLFAPERKRIAFAPSFGRDFVPPYNRKQIKRNVSAIPELSVREESGEQLIYELTGRKAQTLIDPSLLLNRQEWTGLLHLRQPERNEYVLAYFLDEPSEKAKRMLSRLRGKGYTILALPYIREAKWFDDCICAGPKEFLEYLLGASAVCTDSFHGAAFSLNFEKEFYCFEREYGGTANQSTRVTSLLKKVGLTARFDPDEGADMEEIDYTQCREVLKIEREKSKEFLLRALKRAEESEEHQ